MSQSFFAWENFYLLFYVLAAFVLVIFLKKEGKDERGQQIYAKSAKFTFTVFILIYFSIEIMERIIGRFSETVYRGLIFWLVLGMVILQASAVQYFRIKE